MKRGIINIGAYRYLVEYYNVNTDMKNSQYSAEFVMLRNFYIMNNVINDKDIFIIEKSHLYEFIDEIKNNGSNIGYKLAFPITDSVNLNNYSNNPNRFNSNFDSNSIYNKNEENLLGNDIYELKEIVNENNRKIYRNKKIKCDKIRIYHPLTKLNINGIVDITNIINDIKFHYLCRPLSNYKTHSDTEIKYNSSTYSEYIEIYFPNVDELFKISDDGNHNVYYEENYNIIASTRNADFISSMIVESSDVDHAEFIDTDTQIVPLNLLIQPYRIVEEESGTSEGMIPVKLYLKSMGNIENNHLSFPLNVILFPYEYCDEQNNMYILDTELPQSSTTFNNEHKFRLSSRLGFSDGVISIVSLFDYPNKSYFYNKYKGDIYTSPILEAYKYYNNVSENNYMLFVNPDIQKECADIDNVTSISDEMIETVKEITNLNYNNKEEMLALWKDVMKRSIIEEYEEEYGTFGSFLGFKVDIASDEYFKHIVFSKDVRVNFSDLDDFSFKLNGIFEKWEQRPEKLIVKTSFYDRILGIEIISNLVIITKEWFKYLTNDLYTRRLTILSEDNYNKGNLEDMKVIELDENNINFINSINCFVNKHSTEQSSLSSNTNQKIILKPIFYKVKDLQNIKLRSTLPQKIGINLSEYMTKVETFKIIIGNNEFVEYGRNDIFVIFEIDPGKLDGESGKYDIINEDGTYISSGNWTIE